MVLDERVLLRSTPLLAWLLAPFLAEVVLAPDPHGRPPWVVCVLPMEKGGHLPSLDVVQRLLLLPPLTDMAPLVLPPQRVAQLQETTAEFQDPDQVMQPVDEVQGVA